MKNEMERNPPTEEKIQAAALRYRDKIFSAQNHGLADIELKKTFPNRHPKDIEVGFITTSGRFVDKKKALEIAERENQIKSMLKNSNRNLGILGSEDLK